MNKIAKKISVMLLLLITISALMPVLAIAAPEITEADRENFLENHVNGLPEWRERPDERLLPRFCDFTDTVDEEDAGALRDKLNKLSEKHQMDIAVVMTSTLEGLSPMEYANDFYDYYGYGYGADFDGVILLVSMEDRDYWISTRGEGITDFTDAGIEYIGERLVPFLGDGDYVGAYEQFADLADDFINQARSDKPYDVGDMPKEPFKPLRPLMIGLVAGILIAITVLASFRAQLKKGANYAQPSKFIVDGSLNFSNSLDTFLHMTTTKVYRPKTNESGGSSTHTSSSGGAHGGGGGKF